MERISIEKMCNCNEGVIIASSEKQLSNYFNTVVTEMDGEVYRGTKEGEKFLVLRGTPLYAIGKNKDDDVLYEALLCYGCVLFHTPYGWDFPPEFNEIIYRKREEGTLFYRESGGRDLWEGESSPMADQSTLLVDGWIGKLEADFWKEIREMGIEFRKGKFYTQRKDKKVVISERLF